MLGCRAKKSNNNNNRGLMDNAYGEQTSDAFSCSSYHEGATQPQEAATCPTPIMKLTGVIIGKENDKKKPSLSDIPKIFLFVPSGGCASMTSTLNSNCVHLKSIVSITKKPDSMEPCH